MMQSWHLASATPSSAGDINALGFRKKEEINGASAFPQKVELNAASAFPQKEEINGASAFPQKVELNAASAFPQKEEINEALPRTKKSNVASAMLLYQATSGITVFSFDGAYLNDQDFNSDGGYRHHSAKDFWACLPPLTLIVSMKYEKVPNPIDLVNEDIEVRLKERLTKLCGSETKLVVGSAEYKRIIETKLPVTCLYVDHPDCEVIIRSLKNPMQSVKINPALALLLYQAPSGIAIFCFDGGYLNAALKDFWACLPQLSLIVFIKKEKTSAPIDLAKEVIDGHLVKWLKQLCGSRRKDSPEKKRKTDELVSRRKLVVGSAEHKRIIETKLGIPCLHYDVPDCEVKICSLNKHLSPLPPEKQSDPEKDLELFLHQRNFDVKLAMVDESMTVAASLLHDTESLEKKYLKFFRLLLKDFILASEIDTTTWVLIQFATALKMICYPEASYEVLAPDEIFLFDECPKIEAHASRYKRSFSKIDVFSVYEHVAKLDTEKFLQMHRLDVWIKNAKEVFEEADVRLSNDHFSGELERTDLRTGSKVGKDNCSDPDDGKPATKIRTSCKEKRRTGDGTSIKESDSSDIQTNSDSDHEIVKTHDASKSAAQIRTSPAKRWTGEKGSD